MCFNRCGRLRVIEDRLTPRQTVAMRTVTQRPNPIDKHVGSRVRMRRMML